MKEFSLLEFAAFATELIVEVEVAKHEALEKAAQIVETEAKRVIGTYDYGWTPLAESTLRKKAADTPLLESGEMRDSIEHTVEGDEAYIGTDNDNAVWQELGTVKIPPRSFLMEAAVHKEAEVVKVIDGHIIPKLIING